MISGTLGSTPITNGRLRGKEITFTVGDAAVLGTGQWLVDAGHDQGRNQREVECHAALIV